MTNYRYIDTRQATALTVAAIGGLGVPGAMLVVLGLASLNLMIFGGNAHWPWIWLTRIHYERVGGATVADREPNDRVVYWFGIWLNLYVLYQLGELIAYGFRRLKGAMTA